MTDEKVDAYMPLWIGAYLADTLTFTTAQHGAYMLLLMAYWRERAPLADDDEDLAGITKCTRSEWKHMRPKLAKKFQVADGVWRHKRVEQELADAMQRKEKASRKAKGAAEARWGKGGEHSSEHASGDAPSMLQALLGDCPTTSPTPSLSESSEPKGSAGAGAPPVDNSNPEAEARRQLWADSGAWLVANGLTVGDAKAFMNTIAKDFPQGVAEAFREALKTAAPVDAKALVLGIAKRMDGERAKPITVPSTDKGAERFTAAMDERKASATKPPAHVLALAGKAARTA